MKPSTALQATATAAMCLALTMMAFVIMGATASPSKATDFPFRVLMYPSLALAFSAFALLVLGGNLKKDE